MKKEYILELIIVAIVAYVLIAMTHYRFSHPRQTETELFMNFVDAMLWKN